MAGGRLWVGGCCLLAYGCGRFGFDDVPVEPDTAQVTIQFDGTGAGTVVGADGLTCSTTCTFDVTPGTALHLRGLATSESWLAGWNGPCGGNFDCDLTADADVTIRATFTPRPNRAFITSATTDGILFGVGGVAGGDMMCGKAATDAGLDGTWVAYVSSPAVDAVARLAGSRGWIRVDGAPVADLATDFATGPLLFVPRLDENGTDLGRVSVHTGTSAGAEGTQDCIGWTSNLATDFDDTVSTHWGSMLATRYTSDNPCNTQAHLLCLEVGKNQPVKAAPNTGRRSFVTTIGWLPGAGRDSADALCATQAMGANLPGTFLAALATVDQAISDRFPPGLPWRRLDDVRLMRDDTLFTTDFLDVSPEIDLAGAVVNHDFWTGSARWNLPADDLGANCGDWTYSDDLTAGFMGYTSITDITQPAKTDTCSSVVPLLCLER